MQLHNLLLTTKALIAYLKLMSFCGDTHQGLDSALRRLCRFVVSSPHILPGFLALPVSGIIVINLF
jgi:hypothetical protein